MDSKLGYESHVIDFRLQTSGFKLFRLYRLQVLQASGYRHFRLLVPIGKPVSDRLTINKGDPPVLFPVCCSPEHTAFRGGIMSNKHNRTWESLTTCLKTR